MAKSQTFRITAAYDKETSVWFVADSDIPGLCTEGENLDELQANIEALIPDLFELNRHLIQDSLPNSVPWELVAQKELSLGC